MIFFIFQHNTQGINCEKCEVYFFRPVDKNQSDPDACKGKESINEMFVLQLLKVAKDFGHFFLLFAISCDNVDYILPHITPHGRQSASSRVSNNKKQ